MVRITKLTDYGIMIMAFMANHPTQIFQATDIALKITLAKPTVAKLLKKLTKNKLLISQRGIQGGYQLACNPLKTSIADIVGALEGPIAITECNLGHDYCSTAHSCTLKSPWSHINQVITTALHSVKLGDLNGKF